MVEYLKPRWRHCSAQLASNGDYDYKKGLSRIIEIKFKPTAGKETSFKAKD
jgi:hypothetical protein